MLDHFVVCLEEVEELGHLDIRLDVLELAGIHRLFVFLSLFAYALCLFCNLCVDLFLRRFDVFVLDDLLTFELMQSGALRFALEGVLLPLLRRCEVLSLVAVVVPLVREVLPTPLRDELVQLFAR